MQPNVTYRCVTPAECAEVAQLHQGVFPRAEVQHTIYASPRISQYLTSLVTFPYLRNEHELWGAWSADQLIGYAHFRALPDAWHLNYIAVLPAYRGVGIGETLWQQWLSLGRAREYNRFSLDVDSKNDTVLAWYHRKRFHTAQTTWTYKKQLRPKNEYPSVKRSLKLLDWEQAEAWQIAYGFSQFRLLYEQASLPVGRIGDTCFRVTCTPPVWLEAVLSDIDAGRHLLVVSTEPLEDADAKEVGTSFRMCSEL